MNNALPAILIVGYTGAGKTSLLQALFGKGLVSEDRIGHGAPATQKFDLYQDRHLRVYDSKGLEPGEKIEEGFVRQVDTFMDSLRQDAQVDRHIHILWYCLDGTRARVTPCDLRLIRKLWRHVIVVITKSDITRPVQHEAMVRVLQENGITSADIIQFSIFEGAGPEHLVRRTMEVMPAAQRSALRACLKGNLLHSYHDHGSKVWSVAFSPDASLLASAGKDNKVVLRWLDGSGRVTRSREIPTENDVNTVRFSTDGSLLAYGDDAGWVHLCAAPFDQSAEQVRLQLSSYCYSLTFHSTLPLLAAGSRANVAVVFRYSSGAGKRMALVQDKEYRTQNDVRGVTFSSDGRYLFFVDDNGNLGREPVGFDGEARSWRVACDTIRSVDAHPNATLVVVAGDDGVVRVCDCERGTYREIATLIRRDAVHSVRFSPHGELIVFGDDDGYYGVWDWEHDKLLGEFPCGKAVSTVYGIDISSDGRRIATGSKDGHVRVWSLDM